MLKTFTCGTFHLEEEDEAWQKSSDSAPAKSRRNKGHSKSSKNNNPYSTRGLDKFSALLADLDQRRQKIYSQMNPHDISFVRFTYSSTDDFVPVVVKAKNNKNQRKHKSEELRVRPAPSSPEPIDNKPAIESSGMEDSRRQTNSESDHRKAEKKRVSWNLWRRPSGYLPVVMILILVFLVVFGRSAATLCTCIVWYMVPTLKESSKSRRLMKKKEYVRGMSEKKMVSDGVGSPRPRAESPKGHSHRKSW